MYTLVAGSTHHLPDLEAFLAALNRLHSHPEAAVRTLFDPHAALHVARAPGRLDLMGGIADYSGSLVLQLPIREACLVALQRLPAGGSEPAQLQIVSLAVAPDADTRTFTMPLASLLTAAGEPVAYETACRLFAQDPARQWAGYVAGGLLVLMRERGLRCIDHLRILVASHVPEGKGVSSSAALEVATMQALAAAFQVALPPRDLALLCQMVENLVVGAPCGVMDQMAAVVGESHQLMSLLCQPAELQEMVSIPQELAVWGIDSGVRHSVAGADYGSVRVGAFMGYRMIARLAGLAETVQDVPMGGPVQIDDPVWHGYLANLSPSLFAQRYAQRLPGEITGAEFLQRFGGTTDAVTRVDPDRGYAVQVPTTHPIYEHFRVRTFAELLAASPTTERLALLGELMVQSHASYSACGLGSVGTDRLVELVRSLGPARGLYGAKITGGGSGGTVAVLGSRLGQRDPEAAVQEVAQRYAAESGHRPWIFAGSSPGAAAVGALRLRPA